MHDIGALNDHLVGAHMILVNDHDMKLVKESDMGVAHNMSANIKSAKGVSPALKMYDNNIRIGLGYRWTDASWQQFALRLPNSVKSPKSISWLITTEPRCRPPKVIDAASDGISKSTAYGR
ncbi:amidohydrolase family protein [Vibrio sp. PP-XX7]